MWAMGSVLGSLAGVLQGTQGMRLSMTHQRKQWAADRSMPHHLWV